jgi:5-methylcytosine-specific restriction endonuclease McrA
MNKSNIIELACFALSEDNKEKSLEILKNEYPFKYIKCGKRQYTKEKILNIFIRDGFIDRYTGDKLVFPGALKILSNIFPNEFPYHQHGKLEVCHTAYWELMPTIDHILPTSKGGTNNDDNLVTTSMIKNSAKSIFSLDELGWTLYPNGNLEEWDGLVNWFLEFIKENKQLLDDNYINDWYRVAIKKVHL